MWGAQHVQQNAGGRSLSMLYLCRQSKRPINKFDYFAVSMHWLALMSFTYFTAMVQL